jgi:hypothetical protein
VPDRPAIARREKPPPVTPTEEEKSKLAPFEKPKRTPVPIPDKPERGTPVPIPPQHPARVAGRFVAKTLLDTPLGLVLGHRGPFAHATSQTFLNPDLERAVGAWLRMQGRTGTPRMTRMIPGITGGLTSSIGQTPDDQQQ